MANCHLCADEVPDVELLHHLRVIHPEQAEEFERWLDGEFLVVDKTLEPEDFGSAPRRRCVNCDVEGCEGCWGADTYTADDWRP